MLMNCRQPFFCFLIVMAGMSGREKCVDEKETVEG